MTEKAEVISHSRIDNAPDIVTVACVFPRIILPEIATHRVFSTSTQSSRAVPIHKMIEAVTEDPFIPRKFRRNVGGMSGGELLDKYTQSNLRDEWIFAMQEAVSSAEVFANAGASKEHANRLLEPFSHVACVITSTEWDNFFDLRISEHAQPEIRRLATAIRNAIDGSDPRKLRDGEWHLPYVDRSAGLWVKCSAARCARQSYLTRTQADEFDQRKDTALAARLIAENHWSPFEHQAREWQHGDPDNANRNLAPGWSQARALVGG